MKTVEVNQAPIRISHSSRAIDSGRDTFEKKRVLHLVVSEHLEFGSNPPIGSDRKGVLQEEMNNFVVNYEIQLIKSTSIYAQANGQVEASNKVLIRILEKILEENPKD